MKRTRGWYILIIVALVVLGLALAACTRDRPQEQVDSVRVTPEETGSATPTPTPASPESAPEATPTPVSAAGVTPVLPLPTPTSVATPTPHATPTTATVWHWYTVRRGDTLFSIATKFNTTVEELKRLNNLTDSTIYVGQKLKVPGAAQPGEGGTTEYIVQPGDTLFSIAQKFGVDMHELARINNIRDPGTIYVGQKLIIPVSPSSSAKFYKVKPGDTLSQIAERFGVSMQAIMEANGITDPDAIYVGQILRIP